MEKFFNNKKPVAVVILLLVISNIFFYWKWSYEESNYFYQVEAVPHIELISAMAFYGVDSYQGSTLTSANRGDIAVGSIAGFVKFSNLEDQPKEARQYYTITATDSYDERGYQLFTLTDTLKLQFIPPRSFDDEVLRVADNRQQFVTLEAESGVSVRIDKRTDAVTIVDGGGDIVTLITNQSDYHDFMDEFLN